MRRITTVICAILFAVAGVGLAIFRNSPSQDISYGYKSASAAPVLNWSPAKQGKLPLDLQLDLEKDTTCTTCNHVPDTVYKDSIVYRNKYRTKYVYVPDTARVAAKRLGDSIPAIIPDTPAVNYSGVGREEHPTDTIGPPKESIILIVGDEEVYKR